MTKRATTTETSTQSVDLSNLSTKELEQLLAERKKGEQDEKEAKRKGYEARREQLINSLGTSAGWLFNELCAFKGQAMAELVGFRTELLEYGQLRRGDNNKGSFELKNDAFKIVFKTQVKKRFDERAILAEEKLKQFLSSFVKRNDKTYKLIMSLLERDQTTGDFDIDLINRLYKMEHEFDNPLWKESLQLFKESYTPTGSAQYIAFSRKLDNGTWEALTLDFAKVSAYATEITEATTEA